MEIYPMKMCPCFKATPWGGNKLNTVFHKNTGFEITGESWEASAHRNGQSEVTNGQYAGKNLLELTGMFGTEFLGSAVKGNLFPVLFKIIDARDKLSVQVHPTDAYAAEFENDYGKTEMWTVLDATPGAGLYLGFKKPITKDQYRELILKNQLEDVLEFVPAEVGKSYFLPAGLVHAIGSGLLIAEIQQSSDSTYRVYDWGRMGLDGKPRQLHVDKALDVSQTAWKGTVVHSLHGDIKNGTCEWLSACSYFAANKLNISGCCNFGITSDSFHIFFASQGRLDVSIPGYSVELGLGETVIIPAGCDSVLLSGTAEIFHYFVPTDMNRCKELMSSQNISSEDISNFTFLF